MRDDGETDAGSPSAPPQDYRAEVRVWLRLLSCTTLISAELRREFRETFDTTIPRFEILAQLDRQPGGLVLGELSKRLLVSPANLTPIIERLTKDGFITRAASHLDRRIQIVCLTAEGQKKFRRMAKKHGGWLTALFADLPREDLETLNVVLARLKAVVAQRTAQAR
jgi:DNA-binding MarR family transcriptional regulator